MQGVTCQRAMWQQQERCEVQRQAGVFHHRAGGLSECNITSFLKSVEFSNVTIIDHGLSKSLLFDRSNRAVAPGIILTC